MNAKQNTSSRFSGARRQCLGWILAAVAVASVGGCAGGKSVRHEFVMQGQVLASDTNGILVCVGRQNGAESGQILNVVRYSRTTGGNPKAPPFRREQVGQVRIVEVVDDHYAQVTITSGQAQVGDMVVLDN